LNSTKFWLGKEDKTKGYSSILKFYMRNAHGIIEVFEVAFGKDGLQKNYLPLIEDRSVQKLPMQEYTTY
jgi:hypothetical protein